MAKFPDNDVGNMLMLLAKHGVARAMLYFDGGGDSGQINGIETYDGIVEQAKLSATTVTDTDWEAIGEKPQYVQDKSLENFITHAAYVVLNKSEYDWYNNDGGYGSIDLVPGEGRAFIDMNVRVTESVNYEEDFSVEVQQDG